MAPADTRTFRSPPNFLEGAGWALGGVLGALVVPDRQREAYPEFRARTAEAWRRRMQSRKPIPLPMRAPAIFAIALACSFAADCLVSVCEHGATWETLAATRLGGTTYSLGTATVGAAARSWERIQQLRGSGRRALPGHAPKVDSPDVRPVSVKQGDRLQRPWCLILESRCITLAEHFTNPCMLEIRHTAVRLNGLVHCSWGAIEQLAFVFALPALHVNLPHVCIPVLKLDEFKERSLERVQRLKEARTIAFTDHAFKLGVPTIHLPSMKVDGFSQCFQRIEQLWGSCGISLPNSALSFDWSHVHLLANKLDHVKRYSSEQIRTLRSFRLIRQSGHDFTRERHDVHLTVAKLDQLRRHIHSYTSNAIKTYETKRPKGGQRVQLMNAGRQPRPVLLMQRARALQLGPCHAG